MNNNWQSKVYKSKMDRYSCKDPEWIALKVVISIQQKYKCAMCRKEVSDDNTLGLHHIIPRVKNGKDELNNLIGLCVICHDIAELKSLNRNEIINYYNNIKDIKKERASTKDWHMWVYGGFSRPDIRYQKKKVISTIVGQIEYEFPKEIILHEKYIIKQPLTKYTLKYGYTLKEMAKIFRTYPSTIRNWLDDSVKERKIIRILDNFK